MPTANDVAWLEKLHHDFVEAFRNNDLKGLGEFFVTDALLLPPGRGVVAGREEIIKFWEKASRLIDLVFEATDVKMIGDSAFREAGNLLIVRRGPGRETRNVATKFVSLWVKVEDDWKLESLVWNGVQRPRKRARGAGQGRMQGQGKGPRVRRPGAGAGKGGLRGPQQRPGRRQVD
jgi:ketosteroid isomerase-like protein